MGCIQGNKDNYYSFFSSRTVNGAQKGDTNLSLCQGIVGAPFLVGKVKSVSSIQLSWIRGDGAVDYVVYQSTNNFTFIPVATVTDKNYVVLDLDSQTTYYFKVAAVSYLGNDTESNTVEFTTPQLNAPYDLNIDYSSVRTIDLSWLSASNSEEDGFVIQRSLDGVVWYDLDAVLTNVLIYDDDSVLGDLTYYYRVAATGGLNRSFYSNVVSQAVPVVQDPTNLVATSLNPSQIDLIWDSNSEGAETSFSIERGLDGVIFSVLDSVPSGQESYSDLSISNNLEYYYRVQAIETGTTSSGYTNIVSESNDVFARSFNGFEFGQTQFNEYSNDAPIISFVLEIDTSLGDGLASFELPVSASSIFPLEVDWGDGNIDTITSEVDPLLTHNYSAAWQYSIKTTGEVVPLFNNTGDKDKLTDVLNWGGCTIGISAFRGCSNCTFITATDSPTFAFGAYGGFLDCSSAVFNSSIGNWDVSTLSSLRDLFRGCTVFNRPEINNWDLSHVTVAYATFYDAVTFNQPLTNWVLPNHTGLFISMFRNASAFDQDLSNLTFSGCTSLSLFVSNTALSSTNYNALLAKLRWTHEFGGGITLGMTLGASGLVATGQGVIDKDWLIINTAMTIIDATP